MLKTILLALMALLCQAGVAFAESRLSGIADELESNAPEEFIGTATIRKFSLVNGVDKVKYDRTYMRRDDLFLIYTYSDQNGSSALLEISFINSVYFASIRRDSEDDPWRLNLFGFAGEPGYNDWVRASELSHPASFYLRAGASWLPDEFRNGEVVTGPEIEDGRVRWVIDAEQVDFTTGEAYSRLERELIFDQKHPLRLLSHKRTIPSTGHTEKVLMSDWKIVDGIEFPARTTYEVAQSISASLKRVGGSTLDFDPSAPTFPEAAVFLSNYGLPEPDPNTGYGRLLVLIFGASVFFAAIWIYARINGRKLPSN